MFGAAENRYESGGGREDNFLQVPHTGSPLREPVSQTCSDYRQAGQDGAGYGRRRGRGGDVRSAIAILQFLSSLSLGYSEAEE